MTPVQRAVIDDFVGVSVVIIKGKGFLALRRIEADTKRKELKNVSPQQQSI